MSQGRLVMILGQGRRVVLAHELDVVARHESRLGHLVLGHEVVRAGAALQQVPLDDAAESDAVGRLAAKDHDIVKVPSLGLDLVLGRHRGFPEDATRGEHLPDGADHGAQGWKGKVARIVL